jgi:membrane protein YqaA with SNARE-associated domain
VGYLAIAGIVLGVNLLPAFGPPTWSLLVFARLQWHLNPFALVPIGVATATLGRYVLAHAARALAERVPARYRANLEDLRARLVEHRRGALAAAALFLVSPLPSAQLFVAAGLVRIRLLPLAAAFALGRCVSYSLYVGGAVLAERSLRSVLGQFWGSPWALALQLVMLAALTALPLVPWRRRART